ncbi:YccS family putative transporter [Photobacterium marinum]|uniref:YccS family putative transporter n=1 Tax=Photobacterium marinum TaxID=1056511 RepID=UPI0005609C91|nr:YccS family putative transporter [Photobacterium marinum]
MQNSRLKLALRRYWANDRINYSIRVLIALVGVALPCWYFNANNEVTPLVLGIIASALAETDDNLSGRIKALLMTLACFMFAAFSIEILFDYPVLFAIGLFTSTFGFIMLGAMGARYASIAFASLLLAVYTMLGAEHSPNLWYQPMLLLAGASWYGLLSLGWQLLWPNHPVQQGLSAVFSELACYLDSKSKLFEPVTNLQPQPLRLEAASQNARVVAALNTAKATLLHRARRGHPNETGDKFLKIYFLAQDIHERASSSHYRYQDLADTFRRSDVLFRFQRLLENQAVACREIAHALAMGKPYRHGADSVRALDELQESLLYLKSQQQPQWRSLINQLDYLFNNLATVERQLSNVSNPDVAQTGTDTELADTEARSMQERWQRITSQFKPDSMLFRHALRMAIALTVGYGCIQALELERGYWILLTTLFVCQPNYSATRQKLVQRVLGTLGGLLAGIPLLYLFPGQEGQLVLMVLAGVLFFSFRTARYGLATAFITLLVLFCFNQLGEGYAVILPRLGDTLLGCLLAVLAVSFILPDWEARRLHKVMASAITTNRDYLGQIIGQYRIGKKDSLHYRIARRNAHNTDAQLSTAISNMLAEPGRYRMATDECFRFLTLNHAMLSYISALGAHRTRLGDESTHQIQLVSQAYRQIHAHLECLAEQLDGNQCCNAPDSDLELEQRLAQWQDEDCASVRMVLQQLHLIQRMLPELHSLANKLAARTNKGLS